MVSDPGSSTQPETPLRFDAPPPLAGTAGAMAGVHCTDCTRPITDEYFEERGSVVCTECKSSVEASWISGGIAARIGRASLFGLGAALAGAAIYYAVLAITNINFGLISVLVGYMVGTAVSKGSGARGGWRYQALAIVLTYVAIGGTYLPFMFKHETPSPWTVLFALVAGPVLIGVTSPFAGFISAFALFEAWKLNKTRTLAITGPFRVAAAPASPT